MSMKVTVHQINSNTGLAHTIAVDESELSSYLSMGYIEGPAPGDSEISTEANRSFTEKYVPPGMRYEDPATMDYETLINKMIATFEDTLGGSALSDKEFLRSVDDLYEYWDVITKDSYDKVRTLLDPQEISNLVISEKESQLGVFLYHIANIFATKGTKRSITWALSLLDVQVDFIRWYEPEFLLLRPAVEECKTLIKVYVGNRTAVTDELLELVNKLVDFLIDICTVIVGWVYVKSFTDTMDLEDDVLLSRINSRMYDCYSQCILEIYHRKKEGVYGVHAKGSHDSYWYIFGNSWDPIYFLKGCLLHGQEFSDDCQLTHSGIFKHCGEVPKIECKPEAGLIHTHDPTIRHCGVEYANKDLVYHDTDNLTHGELKYISYKGIECIQNRTLDFKRSQWGIYQYPTFMGMKEETSFWSGGSANFTFCNPDPMVIDITTYMVDGGGFAELHNYTQFVHGEDHPRAVHANPNELLVHEQVDYSITFVLEEDITLIEALTYTVQNTLADTAWYILRHDGAHNHENPNTSTQELVHGYDPEQVDFTINQVIDDTVNMSSGRYPVHNGGSYHDGIDRETTPLIESDGKFYARLPNIFEDVRSLDLSQQKAFVVGDGLLELTPKRDLGLPGQLVPDRIFHDSVYIHGDGNNHYGYDEVNHTGTYNWRLTHASNSTVSISTINTEGNQYSPAQDPLLWQIPTFSTLLEDAGKADIPNFGVSFGFNEPLVTVGSWVLESGSWNDDGLWLDDVGTFTD